jgi:SAM-dependent methyltransferase
MQEQGRGNNLSHATTCLMLCKFPGCLAHPQAVSRAPTSSWQGRPCAQLPAHADKHPCAWSHLNSPFTSIVWPQCLKPEAGTYSVVPSTAGGRVLELGCGTGATARWLAHKRYAVTAVDISAAALRAAASAAAAEGLTPDNPAWLLKDIFELDSSTAQSPAVQRVSTGGSTSQATSAAVTPVSGYDFVYDCQGGLQLAARACPFASIMLQVPAAVVSAPCGIMHNIPRLQ